MSDTETKSAGRMGFRKADWTAVAGLLAVVVGIATFKGGSSFVSAWVAWLIAPLLWYFGFAMLVGWAFGRMLSIARQVQRARPERKEVAAEPARPTLVIPTADYAEHDFIFEQVRETA
ncbi:MAG: hypothetical protein ACE14L_17525 [Terriglobales bacterium]